MTEIFLALSGCLVNTGFRQVKVNYRRWIINTFMNLLFKTLYLHCTCSYQLKLHQYCVRHIVVYLFNVIQHYLIMNSKDIWFKILHAQRRKLSIDVILTKTSFG